MPLSRTPSVNSEADQAGMKNTQPDGVIRFDVDYAAMMNEYCYSTESSEVEVKGFPWIACVDYVVCESDLFLSLSCKHEQSTPWNIGANVEFIFIHPDSNKNISVEAFHEFREKEIMCATELPNNMQLLYKNKGFVKDNKISVEVRIWLSGIKGIRLAHKLDFTDPNVPYHDLALVIEGEKIYVSKQILAANSLVFERMFYSGFSEKNKNEIPLNDVDRKEFIELLNLIYSSTAKVEDVSVLKLADRFHFKCVIDRAEDFLIESQQFTIVEKLIIADEYRLFALQEHCFSTLDPEEYYDNIKESPFFNDLSAAMKYRLMVECYVITED